MLLRCSGLRSSENCRPNTNKKLSVVNLRLSRFAHASSYVLLRNGTRNYLHGCDAITKCPPLTHPPRLHGSADPPHPFSPPSGGSSPRPHAVCNPPCTQRRATAAPFPSPEIPDPSPSVPPNSRAPPPGAAPGTAPASWLVVLLQNKNWSSSNPKNWSAKVRQITPTNFFGQRNKPSKLNAVFGLANTGKTERKTADQFSTKI